MSQRAAGLLIGAFILAVFLALFNYLTPSGCFTVVSRVTEVMPDVFTLALDSQPPRPCLAPRSCQVPLGRFSWRLRCRKAALPRHRLYSQHSSTKQNRQAWCRK